MNWYKTSQQVPPSSATKPDLVTKPDEIEAAKEFTEHYVIFRFNNGWTVQKVEKDTEIEEGFLKINSYVEGSEEHLYSLRNEYNVPRANFVAETSKKDPPHFGIREVNYKYIPEQKLDNEKYCNGLLKQFFDYLKSLEMKPKWTEEHSNTENVGIRELKDYIVDPMGIPEFVYSKDSENHTFRIGGDSDSYYEALKMAFNEGWGGGSSYYSNTANRLIDDIFSFAEVREEVGLLDKAVEQIEEWAFDMWCEADWGEQLPERPEEPTKEEFTREYKETPGQTEFNTKEFDKTKNTYFDEKAYNEAVKEYERLEKEYEEQEAELEKYFEPYEFSNYAYKELESLKARSLPKKNTKNKPKKIKK